MRKNNKEGADYDLHLTSNILANRNSVVLVGHGEYWSSETRNRLDSFVANGGNIVSMASNTGYWQIRYESSVIGINGPVVVGYKESALDQTAKAGGGICCAASIPNEPCYALYSSGGTSYCCNVYTPASATTCSDPYLSDGNSANDNLITTNFRRAPVNKPEQLLLGSQFQMNPTSATFEVPVELHTSEIASIPSLSNGISNEGTIQIAFQFPGSTVDHGSIGYEADILHPHGHLLLSPDSCLRTIGQASWIPESGFDPLEAGNYSVAISSGSSFNVDPNSWLSNWGASSSVYSVFLADVTGDGRSDVIVKEKNPPGYWYVAKNTGSNFQPQPAWLVGWAHSNALYDIWVSDINGDGRADLVSKEKNWPGHWYAATSNGTNAFTQQSIALYERPMH